jgi:hypothetical protein
MIGLIPIIEQYYDDRKPQESKEVFDANITNNLGKMADAAGIYKHLWCPHELNIKTAQELIKPLMNGLIDMKIRPEYYKQFNASNGWGLYENFIPWIEKYLEACIDYPNAIIKVSV